MRGLHSSTGGCCKAWLSRPAFKLATLFGFLTVGSIGVNGHFDRWELEAGRPEPRVQKLVHLVVCSRESIVKRVYLKMLGRPQRTSDVAMFDPPEARPSLTTEARPSTS